MAIYVCMNGYSWDTSNLNKLRELTHRLGNTAEELTARLDLDGYIVGDNGNRQ
jgi:hypothetical protein